MNMKKTIFTTFIFLISINISFSQSKVEDIKEFKLDNGMKILVLEDFSIPNANMYLFWKVGSRNEYPGITGLSHFFEHMMFNGSEKYGPKMFMCMYVIICYNLIELYTYYIIHIY